MFAASLAQRLAQRGIFYGWVMVGLTFMITLSTASVMGLVGVLILPFKAEYGWTASQIGGPLSLRLALFGLTAPFAAAFMARYGVRRVVAGALVLIVSGVAIATQMTQLWQLWITWGLMVGLGTGLTALVLGATVSGRWFTARRGLVMGLLTAANATGQLLFLPLAAWLGTHYGWRVAVIPATIACCFAWGMMLLFGCEYPADIGLSPYGETAIRPYPPRAIGNPFASSLRVLGEASASPTFWMLFFTFFVCGLSTNGLVQNHFIPLCHDMGLEEVAAAGVLAMMGAFDFVFFGLSIFAVFYGLDWIATVPPTVRLAAQEFGRDKGPLVFGWAFAAHQLGASVAASAGAMVRDGSGSYFPAFTAAGVACLLAAASALWVKARPAHAIA